MKELREDFPDLFNIGFDEDRSKGKRADQLISDIMNNELKRLEGKVEKEPVKSHA